MKWSKLYNMEVSAFGKTQKVLNILKALTRDELIILFTQAFEELLHRGRIDGLPQEE